MLFRSRYREFYQCDVDIVGQEAPLADAELVAMTYEVLTALGLTGFTIRINHREILAAMAGWAKIPTEKQFTFYSVLDKMEKVGSSSVKKEMLDKGFSDESVNSIFNLIEADSLQALRSAFGTSGNASGAIDESEMLLQFAKNLGVPEKNVKFDLSLARGLDYYSGPIFETVLPTFAVGSLTGGGRYDNLVGSFTGKNTPATGTSFGLERIIDILSALEKGDIGSVLARTQVLVIPFDENSVPYALQVATFLRKEKIRTSVYHDASDKMKDKFTWVSRRKNRFAAVVGPDEIVNREVTYKDMTTGQQEKKKFGELPTGLIRDEQ